MYRGLTLGLYEKAMPATLGWQEKLNLAAAAGFDYLELSVDESEARLKRIDWTKREINDLRGICDKTGVPVRSVCLSAHRKYPLGSRDPSVRARSLEILQKTVDLSVELGVRIIQLAGYDVYYENGGDDTRKFFEEGLERSVSYAAGAGVVLAFETMETAFMNTVEKAMQYVQKIRSPYLQVYPDVGNVTNGAENAIADLRTGEGHIVAAHLKETLPGIFRDLEFGQGRVDFPSCIRTLFSQGVRRFVCEFWYDGVSEPSLYLKRNADYVRKMIDGGMA